MAAKTTKTQTTEKHHRTVAYEVRAADILKAIKEDKGKATAASLDLAPSLMTRMVSQGLVKVTGKVRKPQRGRPAHTYGLTDKGRKLAAKATS